MQTCDSVETSSVFIWQWWGKRKRRSLWKKGSWCLMVVFWCQAQIHLATHLGCSLALSISMYEFVFQFSLYQLLWLLLYVSKKKEQQEYLLSIPWWRVQLSWFQNFPLLCKLWTHMGTWVPRTRRKVERSEHFLLRPFIWYIETKVTISRFKETWKFCTLCPIAYTYPFICFMITVNFFWPINSFLD